MPDIVRNRTTLITVILRVVAVVFLAMVAAYFSEVMSEPPNDLVATEYQQYYGDRSDKPLSEHEFSELERKSEQFLDNQYTPQSLDADIKYILTRKLLVVPLFFAIWAVLGYLSISSSKAEIGFTVVLITASAYVFVSAIEAIAYSAGYSLGIFVCQLRYARSRRSFESGE